MTYIALTRETRSEFREALLSFYDRSARDLPWRRDRHPYRVLVSEVMLQQTRVETVLGYYGRWLEQFPTLEALADAAEDRVLKAWEGLGYYRRARNLHRAARLVRDGRGGALPTTYGDLRELPGVGDYTAGAVASIAFGEPVPAVDGNVRRVLARIFDDADPSPGRLRRRAAALVDRERPGDWNQALMDLGATVCTPRNPACPACPVRTWCGAHHARTQLERPARRPAKAVPRARFALAVLEREGRVLVEKRPAGGMLAGLWAFPERRLDAADTETHLHAGNRLPEQVPTGYATRVARELGLWVASGPRTLPAVPHRFTHLDATYLPEVVGVEGETAEDPTGGPRPLRWIDAGGDDLTALPVAQAKVLRAWCESKEADAV